jgi:dihydroxy-acid dehydratase
MYTANTMASAAEALGMTLPGSSSFPAEYPEKQAEADSIGGVMRNLLELDLKPRDIMTRESFENAMVRGMQYGAESRLTCSPG